MTNWWKTTTGGYVNPKQALSVYPQGSDTSWYLEVHLPLAGLTPPSPATAVLVGVYTSEADAVTVAQRLISGIDPSTLL